LFWWCFCFSFRSQNKGTHTEGRERHIRKGGGKKKRRGWRGCFFVAAAIKCDYAIETVLDAANGQGFDLCEAINSKNKNNKRKRSSSFLKKIVIKQ